MENFVPSFRQVMDLRTTFFWPIHIRGGTPWRIDSASNWVPCDFTTTVWDKEHRLDPPSTDRYSSVETSKRSRFYPWAELRYSEQVFFLPYVQRLLYDSFWGAGSVPQQPVWQRCDVGGVSVSQHVPGFEPVTLDFWVPRLLLYHFQDLDLAVLAVEVALCDFDALGNRAERASFDGRAAEPVSFDATLGFLNRFRRLFAPYYYFETGTEGPRLGELPTKIVWRSVQGEELASSIPSDDETRMHRGSGIVGKHWKWLLTGTPLEDDDSWGLLGDDRLPYLACVSVHDDWFKQAPEVQRNDCIRLCYADDPDRENQPDRSPYAPEFLSDFERESCYDRFWSPGVGWNTRWLSSGYALTALVSGTDEFCNSVFRGVGAQVRHHYYQMCLVAHVQHAALHILSGRLAAGWSDADDNDKRSRVLELFRQWLVFRHEYWFKQLSNQVQPREMFPIVQRHLGLPELFEQVRQEAEEIASYATSKEEELQSKEALRQTTEAVRQTEEALLQTRASTALAKVATVGLAFATVAGIMGMNVPMFSEPRFFWTTLIVAALFAFVAIVVVFIWLKTMEKGHQSKQTTGSEPLSTRLGDAPHAASFPDAPTSAGTGHGPKTRGSLT